MASLSSLFCFFIASSLFASSFAPIFAQESASESEAESKEFVLSLDHSNFSDTVTNHDFIAVEFFAPWCGHCQKFAPEYEKAASILSSHDPPVILAKVDAGDEANSDLANEFEISDLPTIKILKNGGKIIQDYKGPREVDGIVSYLKKQRGPASVEIKSTENATNLVGDDEKIVIVGIFPQFSGEEFENYTTIAEKLRSEYDFGHTSDAKVLPRVEASVAGPVIRIFKPFDEPFVDSENFDMEAIEKFIEESNMPVVTIFDDDTSKHRYVMKFFENEKDDKAMLFYNFSTELAPSFESNFRKLAEQYKGKGMYFLIGDIDPSEGALQYFGVRDEHVPAVVIHTSTGPKYMKPNVDPDQIAPWFKEYEAGNVLPYKKSEPIPENNDEPVKVVVHDSIRDVVFNSGRNVLLKFYAPWCAHCKILAPIIEEVAISYEADPGVVVAKLDATSNDFPTETFDVNGYPTLYFVSASGKVLLFEGERTKEAIVDFIEKNRDAVPGKEQIDDTKNRQIDFEAKDEL